MTQTVHYAQVVDGVVRNVIDFDPTGHFEEGLTWIPCTSQTQIGDLYNDTDQGFASPSKTLAEEKALTFQIVMDISDAKMDMLTASFPRREIETWPTQIEEANAILQRKSEDTPFINAASKARGMDRTIFAKKVLIKARMFKHFAGKIIGKRQYFEDEIETTNTMNRLIKIRREINIWQEQGVTE